MFIAGNWKMNGGLKQRAEYFSAFHRLIKSNEERQSFVFFPPALLAASFAPEPFLWGAQNFHSKLSGACTGENSLAVFRELGAGFCLIGHSERRSIFGESDSDAEKKFRLAQTEGFLPVLCVGEMQGEKRETVLRKQLSFLKTYKKYQNLPWTARAASGPFQDIPFIIAYEPVWAIGAGAAASPSEAAQAARLIREFLPAHKKALVIYGGSVTPKNAGALAATGALDGFLVGGASLKASDFYAVFQKAKAALKSAETPPASAAGNAGANGGGGQP